MQPGGKYIEYLLHSGSLEFTRVQAWQDRNKLNRFKSKRFGRNSKSTKMESVFELRSLTKGLHLIFMRPPLLLRGMAAVVSKVNTVFWPAFQIHLFRFYFDLATPTCTVAFTIVEHVFATCVANWCRIQRLDNCNRCSHLLIHDKALIKARKEHSINVLG